MIFKGSQSVMLSRLVEDRLHEPKEPHEIFIRSTDLWRRADHLSIISLFLPAPCRRNDRPKRAGAEWIVFIPRSTDSVLLYFLRGWYRLDRGRMLNGTSQRSIG